MNVPSIVRRANHQALEQVCTDSVVFFVCVNYEAAGVQKHVQNCTNRQNVYPRIQRKSERFPQRQVCPNFTSKIETWNEHI